MNKLKVSKAADTEQVLYSLSEAKEVLRCGRSTIFRLAEPAHAIIRVGRRTLIHMEKLKRYLDENEVTL